MTETSASVAFHKAAGAFFRNIHKKFYAEKQVLTLAGKGFIFKTGIGIPTKQVFRRNVYSV